MNRRLHEKARWNRMVQILSKGHYRIISALDGSDDNARKYSQKDRYIRPRQMGFDTTGMKSCSFLEYVTEKYFPDTYQRVTNGRKRKQIMWQNF